MTKLVGGGLVLVLGTDTRAVLVEMDRRFERRVYFPELGRRMGRRCPLSHQEQLTAAERLVAASKQRRLAVATHSEVFTCTAQLAILRGDIDPGLVRYVFCSAESPATEGAWDRAARPAWWPPNFMSERFEMARDILRERKRVTGVPA